MFGLNSFVVLSLALGALASPMAAVKRTVDQVEADIASISSQVTTLDNAIVAFPDSGGSLLAALAIHTDAVNLESSINTATADTTNTTAFSEDDAQTILAAVEALQPGIIDTLSNIVAKKPAFQSLPIGGIPALVAQDLQTLANDTSAFEDALVANTPADLQANATAVRTAIDAAFQSAIAAYAS